MVTTEHLGPPSVGPRAGPARVSSVSPDWLTPTARVRSVEDRVAVAELAGDVDLGRQPGPVLDGVLGHHGGVVAGAAGDDDDLVDGGRSSSSSRSSSRTRRAVGPPPVEQRVGHRPGLLVDLLGHEVVVAALLGRARSQSTAERRRARPRRRRGWSPAAPRGASSASWSSARAKSRRVRPRRAGMSEARRAPRRRARPRTRGVSRRAATTTSGSSACTAATENEPRTRPRRRPQGLGQAQAGGQRAPRRGGPAPRCRSSEARVWPGRPQLGGQLGVVLDDPVVDHGQPAGAVEVGVGVGHASGGRGWPSGCGPTPVRGGRRDAVPGADAWSARPPSGSRRPPGPARGSPARHQGDPGRVVAPVLEALAGRRAGSTQCVRGRR